MRELNATYSAHEEADWKIKKLISELKKIDGSVPVAHNSISVWGNEVARLLVVDEMVCTNIATAICEIIKVDYDVDGFEDILAVHHGSKKNHSDKNMAIQLFFNNVHYTVGMKKVSLLLPLSFALPFFPLHTHVHTYTHTHTSIYVREKSCFSFAALIK